MRGGDENVGEHDGAVGVDRRHTMIAPAAFRRHRERGGESPPSYSSSLTFSLDGEGFPLWSMVSMALEGREPL